jgi:hypothetical protein
MFYLLGAQMERHQYLGLKRIAFGLLLDKSTVSGLEVAVTRLDLIVVTSYQYFYFYVTVNWEFSACLVSNL